MKLRTTHFLLSLRIWIQTSLFIGAGIVAYSAITSQLNLLGAAIVIGIASGVGSLPVLLALTFEIPKISRMGKPVFLKMFLLYKFCAGCSLLYALPLGLLWNVFFEGNNFIDYLTGLLWISAALAGAFILSVLVTTSSLQQYFSISISSTQNKKMETTQTPGSYSDNANPGSHKILIKGLITGALILLMMIPTVFIQNLVNEREGRQKEIAAEVSSKWGSSQTLTGPYLYVPYKIIIKKTDGKTEESISHFWIIPDELDIAGNVTHQVRPRSIYKVLLYRADLAAKGNFLLSSPKDVDPNSILWNEANICFSLSDFKGIEERLNIHLNGKNYELSPGLPAYELSKTGLSAPFPISLTDSNRSVTFTMPMKIKGSGQLHFEPLGGNSSFALSSKWPSPSFDGNSLPTERNVSKDGFTASWKFNKANLPFGTVFKNINLEELKMDFGVTLLEPADQYAKTSRSVKYAILFIGLTFGLFFIVELMQHKPFHPVQYVLIGIALVIFYTLLLSISEFILFDLAYLIASAATIFLVTAYAAVHFHQWKTAAVFGTVLSILYGFIFVLIRLEDTALLVGSIGLFIVLGLVMYASRKINWYGNQAAWVNNG